MIEIEDNLIIEVEKLNYLDLNDTGQELCLVL